MIEESEDQIHQLKSKVDKLELGLTKTKEKRASLVERFQMIKDKFQAINFEDVGHDNLDQCFNQF